MEPTNTIGTHEPVKLTLESVEKRGATKSIQHPRVFKKLTLESFEKRGATDNIRTLESATEKTLEPLETRGANKHHRHP